MGKPICLPSKQVTRSKARGGGLGQTQGFLGREGHYTKVPAIYQA